MSIKTTYKLFVTDGYIKSIPLHGTERIVEFCERFSPIYERSMLTAELDDEELVVVKLQYGDIFTVFKVLNQ